MPVEEFCNQEVNGRQASKQCLNCFPRGVFRTQSNIYNGAFCENSQLKIS